jgi:hypothetical protein
VVAPEKGFFERFQILISASVALLAAAGAYIGIHLEVRASDKRLKEQLQADRKSLASQMKADRARQRKQIEAQRARDERLRDDETKALAAALCAELMKYGGIATGLLSYLDRETKDAVVNWGVFVDDWPAEYLVFSASVPKLGLLPTEAIWNVLLAYDAVDRARAYIEVESAGELEPMSDKHIESARHGSVVVQIRRLMG